MSATRSAVIRSAGLLGVKSVAFLLTGSAALMASMIDSIVDVFASLIAHLVKPRNHYAEHQLALIQSSWILMGGFIVLLESIRGFNEPVELASMGVAILVLTLVVDGSIVRSISKDKNPVVHGLAEDIKADMLNSLGGVVALTAITLGAPMMVDKIIAIAISIALIVKGSKMIHENLVEASEDHVHEHAITKEEEGTFPNTLAP